MRLQVEDLPPVVGGHKLVPETLVDVERVVARCLDLGKAVVNVELGLRRNLVDQQGAVGGKVRRELAVVGGAYHRLGPFGAVLVVGLARGKARRLPVGRLGVDCILSRKKNNNKTKHPRGGRLLKQHKRNNKQKQQQQRRKHD